MLLSYSQYKLLVSRTCISLIVSLGYREYTDKKKKNMAIKEMFNMLGKTEKQGAWVKFSVLFYEISQKPIELLTG